MPDIRDSAWQFWGVVVTLLVALFGAVGTYIRRTRKILSYEVLANRSILTAREEIEGKLQILFNGETVTDVSLLEIRVVNSGNIPIQAADYERPLSLSLGDTSKILTAEVTAKKPESLSPEITIENSNKLVFRPVLLNGGDAITVKLLVTQYNDEIRPDARIINVSDVRETGENYWMPPGLIVIGLIVMSLAIFFGRIPVVEEVAPRTTFSVTGIVGFTIGYISLLGGLTLFLRIVRKIRNRRKKKNKPQEMEASEK